MKHFLIITMFLFSQVSMAADMPKYLKDGVITVTLKDGKTYTFSANEYKVVKRVDESEQQKPAPRHTEVATQNVESKSESLPYRLTLHGGLGMDGHAVHVSPNQVDVTERKAFVYGASLSGKISQKSSLGLTVLNNDTYLLGLGYDFK